MQTNGYFRSLLIAFVAAFAAPVIMCIAAGARNLSRSGSVDVAVLMAYGLAALAFSVVITCTIAAVTTFVLRLTKIRLSDGYAALAIATVLIVVDAVIMGVEHAFPWLALPIGANALAFFLLDKYCGSLFGKVTTNK